MPGVGSVVLPIGGPFDVDLPERGIFDNDLALGGIFDRDFSVDARWGLGKGTLGGTAPVSQTYAIVGTGVAVLAGVATGGLFFSVTGTGSAVLGGVAPWTHLTSGHTYDETGHGLGTFGGVAFVGVDRFATGAGSIVLAGTSLDSLWTAPAIGNAGFERLDVVALREIVPVLAGFERLDAAVHGGSLMSAIILRPNKYPNEVLPVQIDWSDFLAYQSHLLGEAVVLATSAWTVDADLAIDVSPAETMTTTHTGVWISGGTARFERYMLTNTITTDHGHTTSRVIAVRVL